MDKFESCPKCGTALPETNADAKPLYVCPHCGVNMVQYNLKQHVGLQSLADLNLRCWLRELAEGQRKPFLFGLLGCLLMGLGVFLPVLQYSRLGYITYFYGGQGHGAILLALASISLVLVFSRHFRLLWVTGGLSVGLLCYSWYRLFITLQDIESRLQHIKGSLSEFSMDTVQVVYWGWAVIVLGVCLLLYAAAYRRRVTSSDTAESHKTS